MITSALASLVTEAIKKILKEHQITYHANTLTGIVATVLSLCAGVGYILFTGIPFNAQSIIYVIALIFLSWLCSMVGYDKVTQTLSQIKTSGKENE
jgi:hypothetical protein